jgi:hypothetical protein
MKLKSRQAECLLSLTTECADVRQQIVTALDAVEARSAVKKIEEHVARYLVSEEQHSMDECILRNAINAVDSVEDALMLYEETFARRKMEIGKSQRGLMNTVSCLSMRLYRTLWDLTLTSQDVENKNRLLGVIAALIVLEDAPCGKYEKVANGMSGVLAFEHCYGVTFIEYHKGDATNRAWSVLRTTLEEAVAMARTDFPAAVKTLQP